MTIVEPGRPDGAPRFEGRCPWCLARVKLSRHGTTITELVIESYPWRVTVPAVRCTTKGCDGVILLQGAEGV